MSLSLLFAQHVSNASTSSSGVCDCVYCSGSMCVGVTVWFGWGDVVSLCRMRQTIKQVTSVGLSLFNYQDDARSNKHNDTNIICLKHSTITVSDFSTPCL